MTGPLRLMWRDNKLLLSAFLLAATVTVFFAVRTISFSIYWTDPAHRNQAIEPWMTPRYIAHSWDVPPPVVVAAMGLEPGTGRITVAEVAARDEVPVDDLVQRVMAAIIAHRAARPQDDEGPAR